MNNSNRALTLLWFLFALVLVIVSSAPDGESIPGQNPGSGPPPGSDTDSKVPPGNVDADGTDVTTGFDYSTILEIVTVGDASTTVRPTTTTTRLTTQSRRPQDPTSSTAGKTTKPTMATSPKTTSQPTTETAANTPEQQQETNKPDEAALPATSKAKTKMPPTVPDTEVKTDGPNYSQGQTVSQMHTKKDTGGFLPPFDKDSFTAKVLLPIAAGIVLAVFIVLIGCSVRSCLEKNGQNNSRKRLMEHDMAPADRVMLLAESSEDEF